MSKERSTSRGRDAFSTGRGGLGNIRQASASGSPRTRTRSDGPDDFSDSRGREPVTKASAKLYSTGRGGAGNIRSPSRDPSKPPAPNPIEAAERDIIRNHIFVSHEAPSSTGRGGVGNISSRSRSRGPVNSLTADTVHSTGRGGVGNILTGDPMVAETLDEAERKRLSTAGYDNAAYHSTGRGGLANLTSGPQPPVEHVVHNQGGIGSTGRGGAGNIKHNS